MVWPYHGWDFLPVKSHAITGTVACACSFSFFLTLGVVFRGQWLLWPSPSYIRSMLSNSKTRFVANLFEIGRKILVLELRMFGRTSWRFSLTTASYKKPWMAYFTLNLPGIVQSPRPKFYTKNIPPKNKQGGTKWERQVHQEHEKRSVAFIIGLGWSESLQAE